MAAKFRKLASSELFENSDAGITITDGLIGLVSEPGGITIM